LLDLDGLMTGKFTRIVDEAKALVTIAPDHAGETFSRGRKEIASLTAADGLIFTVGRVMVSASMVIA
jgi:hypothetical protein